MSQKVDTELIEAEKWEHCIENSIRKTSYGTLIGGALALLLSRKSSKFLFELIVFLKEKRDLELELQHLVQELVSVSVIRNVVKNLKRVCYCTKKITKLLLKLKFQNLQLQKRSIKQFFGLIFIIFFCVINTS